MSTLEYGLIDDMPKETRDFKELHFPLTFEFKIGTLANDFIATDAKGNTVAYVRQKMFKLKEDVLVYTDDSKSTELYRIRADKWIDFNTNYAFQDKSGEAMGSVGRKGMRSLWKASYHVFNPDKNEEYHISEENPWAKVGDALMGEIPVVSLFTGYLFNPKYIVNERGGTPVVRLSKEPSLFGRRFRLDNLGEMPPEDGERIMLSLMMMVLLERRRG